MLPVRRDHPDRAHTAVEIQAGAIIESVKPWFPDAATVAIPAARRLLEPRVLAAVGGTNHGCDSYCLDRPLRGGLTHAIWSSDCSRAGLRERHRCRARRAVGSPPCHQPGLRWRGQRSRHLHARLRRAIQPDEQAISLAGWSVQYASATGTGNFGFNATNLTPLSSVLQPGQYLLIRGVQGNGGTTPLPQPDIVDTTPLDISATGAKVALVNSTGALGCGGSTPCSSTQRALIEDLVGWGDANFFEVTPGPATSNTTALIRRNGGCTDTDYNGADFTTGPPVPRNTASPRRLRARAALRRACRRPPARPGAAPAGARTPRSVPGSAEEFRACLAALPEDGAG
jgi:hypothetical protein